MLSNSCRYGIRAVIYIASQAKEKQMVGIKQISGDLNLPTPFLAKILQQLAKQKILISAKGPHGGFALLKAPSQISLLDIIKTIDGDEIFTQCVMHNSTCKSVEESQKPCAIHDDYSKVRAVMIELFNNRTIDELVKKASANQSIII